ncbi:RNA-binding ribosome biosynthesis protein MRD1 [Sporobolomyces koalae]|uniref:RNA-binding ribosome biosynthesis protein MRD1 n=1 Tax=Sporobolomyces koalae TaxID=500713 RepID=UPI00316CC002
MALEDSRPTRLLFTGLHPSLSSRDLRTHLEQCPPGPPSVTDIKVVTRPDGTSRCIAFAGFKSHDEADRARAWANGTWITGSKGGSRVKVDWAKDARDSHPPAKRQKVSSSTASERARGATSDSRFQDFLAVMAPPRPSALHDQSETVSSTAAVAHASKPVPDLVDETPAPDSAPALHPPSSVLPVVPANDDAAIDDSLTDAEYLARRMKRTITSVESEDQVESFGPERDEPSLAVDSGGPTGTSEQAEASSSDLTLQAILETGRLFLRNLAFSATSEDLELLFGGYGQIDQVHLPIDKSTGASKGLAYITFQSPQAAVEAYTALDGRTFQGRLLHILPAIGRLAKPDRSSTHPSSLKAERLEARKQTGGKAFSWGTLYLNSNAALSAVADRLGIAKSALLDPSSSGDPAVKVALAEAHTLGEIKQFFENEGVNIEAFGQPGPRSSTCILLKNLPYGSTVGSLTNLLAPFGQPNRLLVPPSGTIAIVEMPDAQSAATAWRGLLYKQFGGSVLYLEKAPGSIWSSENTRPSDITTAAIPVGSQAGRRAAAESSIPETPPGATLFIKNLNFVTTSARLQQTFGHLDDLTFARVQTKPDPHQTGKSLSMGYGFVGFRTVEAATRAKAILASQVLDGHQLDVRFAQRGATQETKGSTKKTRDETTTKMLVKNVPFEATRKELRELFSAYGQLKSVRLPRKMDSSTRGFAFLDFATRRDAEAAFSALEHTHLLGRHLVLQWAGEDADEPREQQALSSARLNHKKAKFVLDSEAN